MSGEMQFEFKAFSFGFFPALDKTPFATRMSHNASTADQRKASVSSESMFNSVSLGFQPRPDQGLSVRGPGLASARAIAVCPLRGQTDKGSLFF